MRHLRFLVLLIPVALVTGIMAVPTGGANADPLKKADVPVKPCADCEMSKALNLNGGNIEDAARKMKEYYDLKREKKAAESARLRYLTWKGTKIHNGDENPAYATIAIQIPALPAPKERVEAFKEYYGATLPLRVVGWQATIKKVTAVDGGSDAEISFVADIVGKKGGLLIWSRTSVETWHFPFVGTPSLKSCRLEGNSTKMFLGKPSVFQY